MAKKPVKRDYEELTLPEMTEAERLEYIKKLEDERDNVIFELEQRMVRLSKILKSNVWCVCQRYSKSVPFREGNTSLEHRQTTIRVKILAILAKIFGNFQ